LITTVPLTTKCVLTGKIAKMSMEDLMNFFQGSLEKDFGYSDDHVIESLRNCAEELRRAHLDLPPPPTDNSEIPTQPFGVFVAPTIDQIIGRQSMFLDGRLDDEAVVIPADGGPVVVPMRSSIAVNHRPSSVASSSVQYDTATDGMSSRRISVRDGRSSVTSIVDEFLDVDDDLADTTADVDELHVDYVEVNDDFADTQQWPWSSSMPYISSPGPTSRMSPALKSPQSVSPLSDTACITVGRNTVGMVSLNQPVSLVTVVTDDGDTDTPTPAADQRPPSQHVVTPVGRAAAADDGVRDFFAPTSEPWPHHTPSSAYPSFALSSTMYHLYALKSAKDLSRQRYFSSGRVDGKGDASSRSRPNGLSMQVARHQQPGAVSAPVISSVWPENNGWSASPVSSPGPVNANLMPREQPVIRSRVLSPTGSQVGSKVIFPGGDASSSRLPYMSSVAQPLMDSPANWTYRL